MGDSIPMFQQLSLKCYSTAGGIPAACLKEISTLKMLAHPNVVRVSGVERSGGGGGATLTVAFDLSADHLALEHLIADPARWRRLDPKRLMKQLLGALAHCHIYGVAHRCVNPSTIAVSPDGALKLAGFSHLHSVGNGPGQPISMQTREAYMSPEALYCALGPVLNLGADAAKGRAAPLYFSSDVWAAACVLLDVLCARASVEPTQPLRCTSPNAERTNISEAALLHQLTAVYAACGVSTSPVAAPWEHAGACVDTAQCAPAAPLGPEGRQFLQAALQFNPVLRGTAASLLALPYLCGQEAEDSMITARAGSPTIMTSTWHASTNDFSYFIVTKESKKENLPDHETDSLLFTPIKANGVRRTDMNIHLLTERHEIRKQEVRGRAALTFPEAFGDNCGINIPKRKLGSRNLTPAMVKIPKIV